jgi:hypothetical protein
MTDSLERVLGVAPPAGVAALSDDERAKLLAVIEHARRKQAEDLEASFHATLKHIPFPLRGVVKKALLG